MPGLQELIDSPAPVRFVCKGTGHALRVNLQGQVDVGGAAGALVWFDVTGTPEDMVLHNVRASAPIGCMKGKPVVGGNSFIMRSCGNGSVCFTNPNGRRYLAARGRQAVLVRQDAPDVMSEFIPYIGSQPFPIVDAPETELGDGSVIRLKPAHGNGYLRILNDKVDCKGGNGLLPYTVLIVQPSGVFLKGMKTNKLLFFAGDMVAASPTGSPVQPQAQPNGAYVILDSTGMYALAHQRGMLFGVPKDSHLRTQFAVSLETPPETMHFEAPTLAAPEFLESDDEDDIARAPPAYEDVLALDREQRKEEIDNMDPAQRAAFRMFAKAKAHQKLVQKKHRRAKRQAMAVEVDEETAETTAKYETMLQEEPTPEVIDEILDLQESEDDIDDEEVARVQEEAERLNEEAKAAMEAEVEAMRQQMEAQRAAMEAERQRMEEEQARMREEMEARMAEMMAKAEEEAAAEEQPPNEDSEDSEPEPEPEQEGVDDDEADAVAPAEGTEAGVDAEINTENTIETEVMLPPTSGTVMAMDGYDAEANAQALKKAFRGFGCDKDRVVEIMLQGNGEQRRSLITAYKTMYGKDLIKELSSEIGGKLGSLIQALMQTPAEFDAWSIHKAVSGLGTTDHVLIEIICTRSNEDIAAIKEAYRRMYSKDLEKVVMKETGGNYKRLLISLLQGGRNTSEEVDEELAMREATLLHKSTKGWFTDESSLNQVLALRSPVQIRATCKAYAQIAGQDITRTLRKRLSHNVANGMTAVVSCARNPARFFAERIYRACKGLGTNDVDLMRIIVSRSEVDMVQIKEIFPDITGKSLAGTIKSETSGTYRRLLLGLIGE
eukprot:m.84824 g.84824  ORF g.84824 m.84824 type:complete len:833 (-) comp14403_c0_seq2:869-3367(-)